MEKRTFANRRNGIFYMVIILLSIVIYLISLSSSLSVDNLPDIRIKTTRITSFSGGWHQVSSSGEKEAIPDLTAFKAGARVPVTFSRALPELTDYDCLILENNYTYMKVFVGGSCVYDYSLNSIKVPSEMTGHFICQIPLSADMSGQTITIEIYQPLTFLPAGIRTIKLGPGSAYITDYLYSHLELIVSLFIMVITGIILIGVYFWQMYKHMWGTYRMFRSLSLFILFSALWIFTDSQLPQLLWGNSIVICVISFYSFMAIPIPLFSFLDAVFPKGTRMLSIMRPVLLLNILVQGTLYSIGKFSFVQMLPVTHFFFALSIIWMLLFLARNYRKNESHFAKPLLLALILLILSGTFSLIFFYLQPQADNSQYFRYGFLIFIGVLIYISIRSMLTFIHEYTEHRILKELAYTDILTGAESRLAFEEFMDGLRKNSVPSPVTFYAFDLNNLKVTNDAYGHKAGDVILQESASCLLKVFQKGRTFRIGGDEFVVVIQNQIQNPSGLLKELENEVKKTNETCPFPFTISAGCSSAAVCGNSVELLLKKADIEMYKEKERYREQFGGRTPGGDKKSGIGLL